MLYKSYRRRGYTRRNSMMYNQLIQSYLLRYLQFNQRLMPFANVNYNLPTNYNLMPMMRYPNNYTNYYRNNMNLGYHNLTSNLISAAGKLMKQRINSYSYNLVSRM